MALRSTTRMVHRKKRHADALRSRLLLNFRYLTASYHNHAAVWQSCFIRNKSFVRPFFAIFPATKDNSSGANDPSPLIRTNYSCRIRADFNGS